MGEFLDTSDPPELGKDDITHLNRPLISEETEGTIEYFQTVKQATQFRYRWIHIRFLPF